MAINTLIVIAGKTISDVRELNIERNIGEFNANSNFVLKLNTQFGLHASDFEINDEVVVYADLNTAPVTKIFTGVIEKKDFNGEGTMENLTLRGRDYGAVLQDMTVQPVVYTDEDAGSIAKKIIQQNATGVVTTNNVDTTSGTTISKISFNHKNLFDAIKQLSSLAEFIFYVDEDRDVHFEAKESVSSGETFDSSNVLGGSFKTDDREVFNKVWQYGDRILTGTNDTGGTSPTGAAGSVFKLTDQPHNTRVFVDSVLQTPGGVTGINDPSTDPVKYLVDFQDKQITFTSGTTAGDNVPVSGASNISVDYERSTPILKFVQDADSIAEFGAKTKVLNDSTIKNFDEANDKAVAFLAEHKEAKIMGDLSIKGVLALTPGNTALVNLPNFEVVNQTYGILSVRYRFTPTTLQNEDALSITLNRKTADFTDVMKDQMLRMKDVEGGQLEGVLTRLETSVDSVPVESRYEAWGVNIGDNFVFHSDKHGRLNSPDSRIGLIDAGSSLLQSGGYA